MSRYDVEWTYSLAARRRVAHAMRATAAQWIAEPALLSTDLVVATVEVEDAELWRRLANPLRMVPMQRNIGEVTSCDL